MSQYRLLDVPVSNDYTTFDELTGMLRNYLPLSGGSISGDTEVYKSDLDLYIGNFKQSDSEYSINYGSKNAFLQGESAPTEFHMDSYGPVYTGTKGYCILSIDTTNNVIKLSGDISALTLLANDPTNIQTNYNTISDKAFFPTGSKALKQLCNNNFGTNVTNFNQLRFVGYLHTQGSAPEMKILSVIPSDFRDYDNNISAGLISVDAIPTSIINVANNANHQSEDGYLNDWLDDDNAFYCPGLPELGNVIIHQFSGQHAEGGSSRAIGKFAHVEGRDNFADGKFSHAEGTCNFAGKIASHVEGRYCQAIGEYSHASGMLAISKDDGAWTWNGIDGGNTNTINISHKRESNGSGTFNIYPRRGINGFFIDGQTLSSIIDNAIVAALAAHGIQ